MRIGAILLGLRAVSPVAALAVSLAACPSNDTAAHVHADAQHRPGGGQLGTVATRGAAQARAGKSTGPVTGLALGRKGAGREFLTDVFARPLYVRETGSGEKPLCDERCTTIWPPFLSSSGPPVATDSLIDPHRIGTVQRRNGASQATYYGRPLHYYIGDGRAGATLGSRVEDAWGKWYLLSPGGDVVDDTRRQIRRDSTP